MAHINSNSFCTDSTLFLAITRAINISFNAYIVEVFKCYTRNTFPNPPLPIESIYLKSDFDILTPF